MFDVQKTVIPGLSLLKPKVTADARGYFVKTIHSEFFRHHGMTSDYVEQYYTVSGMNVVRGMHFQRPPMDHTKLVTCISGKILDVVIDLREGSPTYRLCRSFELEGERGELLYIPKGCAHGFLSQSQRSIVLYNVSSLHAPEYDTGILWSSIGFSWPIADPVLSDRDRHFPSLEELPPIFTWDRP
jgi:dTDP-4-dehydrorhamnose 3,5-epimerase